MSHRRVTLPPSSFCKFSSNREDPNHNFVHPLRQGAQLLIFCIISLAPSMGTLIIQAIFPNDKRVPRSVRWKQKPHNSKKLCNNNKSKPSWLMWKSWLARMKNCKRQWNPKMQNVGERVRTRMKKNQTLKPTSETDIRRRFHQSGEWASQHKEGDGQTKKCYEGQRRKESRWDDSKDRLTIH